jgi:hypothetical protein
MFDRRFTLILAMMCGCTMCADDRPALDEKVGSYGKSLGEATEEAAKDPSEGGELRLARQRFIASSHVQLGVMASEVESRSRNKGIPLERIENLRKDYWLLVELRAGVLAASDEGYDDALGQFEAQVDTLREQLARVDRGQHP